MNKDNVSKERYYIQQAINVIGLFGPWGAAVSKTLSLRDTTIDDQIENSIRKE